MNPKKSNAAVFNLPAFISSRLIKIIANLLKGFSYFFHYFFPNKRFIIPDQSPAIIKRNSNHHIKKTLWQTNFTNQVTLPVYLNYIFNRIMAYDYEYRLMVDSQCLAFIQDNFPGDIAENYSKLQIGAAKADFWRVLVLYKLGGVYLDMDANLVKPLHSIIKPCDNDCYLVIKRGELSNYFIASKNNNKRLIKIIDIILNNIKNNSISNIYDLTGPGVFNEAFEVNSVNTAYYRYTCNQGTFTNAHFQYMDKPAGKWTREQEKKAIVK